MSNIVKNNQLLAKIKPAVKAETQTETNRNGLNTTFVNHVTELNIANALQSIYLQSEIVSTMIKEDEIGMVGAMYDVNSGKVKYKNYAEELIQLDVKANKELAAKLDQVLQEAKIN